MKYIYIIISIIVLIFVFLIRRKYQKNDDDFEKAIKVLYRQSARWGAAALQDESEMIALLHANYAAGYLWSIKDIISSQQFKEITGVDFLKFENRIVEIQDIATKRMIKKCPDLIFLKDEILLAAMYSRESGQII
jgi:hypothetical protein